MQYLTSRGRAAEVFVVDVQELLTVVLRHVLTSSHRANGVTLQVEVVRHRPHPDPHLGDVGPDVELELASGHLRSSSCFSAQGSENVIFSK